MIPYVIDRQKRNNYITLFFIFTLASFALGYYLGFQTAVIQSSPAAVSASAAETMKPEAEKVATPEAKKPPVVKKETASAAKTSATSSAKVANNKVDPSVAKQVAAKKTRPVQQSVAKKIVAKKPEVKVTNSSVAKQPESSVSLSKGIQSPGNIQSQPSSQPVASTVPANTNPAPASQSLTGTYSVQAGLFGSRKNALKYIDKLKASGFEAYLNEYLASDGVMRYNVRFGYFPDRKTGESRLADFKTQFTTPAYLVINK